MLAPELVREWLDRYPDPVEKPKIIGLVMAGNLPLVGFHDLICIIAAGHQALIKTSSQDEVLPLHFVQAWMLACPFLEGRLQFTAQLKGFNGVIATGSSNTSRYFDYYFGRYPSILRKNRSSVAILTGGESDEQLKALADDVLLYFGFGCRSVSSLLVPEGYDLNLLFKAFSVYDHLSQHHKFANNLDYHRALFLLNKEEFFDLGTILLRPADSLHSPGAVLNLIYYSSLENALEWVRDRQEEIQVIVSGNGPDGAVPFGQAQMPGIADYADGIDTMAFLHALPESRK